MPLIFSMKATRMESVRARAALVRLGSSQISKRLTLVAVANDGFILSCTRRPSSAREKEKKKGWNSSKHKLKTDKSVPCKHKAEWFNAVA